MIFLYKIAVVVPDHIGDDAVVVPRIGRGRIGSHEQMTLEKRVRIGSEEALVVGPPHPRLPYSHQRGAVQPAPVVSEFGIEPIDLAIDVETCKDRTGKNNLTGCVYISGGLVLKIVPR